MKRSEKHPPQARFVFSLRSCILIWSVLSGSWDHIAVDTVVKLNETEKSAVGSMLVSDLDFTIADLKQIGFSGPSAARVATWIKKNKPAPTGDEKL